MEDFTVYVIKDSDGELVCVFESQKTAEGYAAEIGGSFEALDWWPEELCKIIKQS